jgi:predicted permease
LAILLTLTSLVLVVACVNLAGLQLARGAARQREIGVRLALGVGRGRLIRQLVTESLLLSVISAATGIVCAVAGAQTLASWSAVVPGGQTLTVATSIGWDAVVFAAVLAILTTTVVGLLPAWRASRPDIITAIHSTPATGPRLRSRAFVVAGQLSLTTVLLVLASVLARSLLEARGIHPGFSAQGVLSVSIDVSSRSYSREQGGQYFQELRERLEGVPSVTSASLAELVPLTLSGRSRLVVRDGEALPTAADRESLVVYTNNVSPGFFTTLGITLLAGRDFDGRDRADQTDVAIVNETMARRYWPNDNPLGHHFRMWNGTDGVGPPIEVIGLAHDSKYVSIGEEQRAFFYRPLAQAFAPDVTMLITTIGEPLGLLPALRAELRTFDPDLALVSAAPLVDQTRISLLPVQVAASVAVALGLVVLALAAIGTYGVTAYDVRRRTREFAIRVALGADARDVVVGLVRERMWWTIAAVGGGLAVAGVASSILSTLLYGVNSRDPIAFAAVPLMLCGTALLAVWWPARRAARVDPMVALRCE